MKTHLSLIILFLAFVYGCRESHDEPQDHDIGSSSLSSKPSILKVSYTETAQRKAEFA